MRVRPNISLPDYQGDIQHFPTCWYLCFLGLIADEIILNMHYFGFDAASFLCL